MKSAAGFPQLRGLPMSDCRECAAPIRFVRLDTGRALPVDPLPNAAGNVCARRLGNGLNGYVISKEHGADPHFLRFMPHHATCENRTRTAKAPEPTLF